MTAVRILCVAGLLFLSGGCTAHSKPVKTVEAIQAESEIPESTLLDVGIEIFDPGLLEEDEDALEKKGIFADVRKSESRFLPVQLKDTLQGTGQWGAVRVIPKGVENVDLVVSGTIVESTGMELQVAIQVTDATGRVWIKKQYKEDADYRAYGDNPLQIDDPYHNLYSRIANDILVARDSMDSAELADVRRVSGMRFAADLAPEAYSDYVATNRKGYYVVRRLPADGDPMMQRILRIREREYMFVDTLNEHYATFFVQMEQPYDSWRGYSYEEQKALRQMKKERNWSYVAGAIMAVGAAVVGGGTTASSVARDGLAVGSAIAIKHGLDLQKESKIHVEALKELVASLDAEVAPMLIEVEGQTLKLSGSVDAQYTEWRKLLRQILERETGLPIDPNAGDSAAAED